MHKLSVPYQLSVNIYIYLLAQYLIFNCMLKVNLVEQNNKNEMPLN